MATQEQRKQATRKSLIETATKLLKSKGIRGTTTRSILETAEVSRGAMYHHFDSLEDLMAVVYENESKGAITRALKKKLPNESPIEDLQGTCLAWLDEIVDTDVATVLLIEGPAAIGWERCKIIEAEQSLAQLNSWLKASKNKGEICIESTELVARIINAILTESALSILKSKGAQTARDDAEFVFKRLISGLKSSVE